jgi:hypothetical protein
MKMGEKANDQNRGSVTWKTKVGEAASRSDNGYRGRFSWALKPRPGDRKSGEK